MLHYTTYIKEEGADWVTFVHGAGGSSNIWFRQIRDFKEHFNVLLLDLRGHGKSKEAFYTKLKRYTFSQIGDEIVQVLDHLKIAKTHFVGISLGTIIIREIAERYPERTQSMVMGGAVMKLNLKSQILMRFAGAVKSVVPYMVLYKILSFVVLPKKKHKESRVLFIEEAKKLYQKEFRKWFALVSEIKPLLNLFRSKDAGVPTLYVMGEEDYMFLPSISKLVENHASAQLHVIPVCGHVVNVEKPEEFNSQVIHFLKGMQQSA